MLQRGLLDPLPTRVAAEAAAPPANNPPLACLLGPDLRARGLPYEPVSRIGRDASDMDPAGRQLYEKQDVVRP